jgi:hypothetical protein
MHWERTGRLPVRTKICILPTIPQQRLAGAVLRTMQSACGEPPSYRLWADHKKIGNLARAAAASVRQPPRQWEASVTCLASARTASASIACTVRSNRLAEGCASQSIENCAGAVGFLVTRAAEDPWATTQERYAEVPWCSLNAHPDHECRMCFTIGLLLL